MSLAGLTADAIHDAGVLASVFSRGGILSDDWVPPPWPTEPSNRGIKDYEPLPSRNADSPQRIAFIRSQVRLYVHDVAIHDLAGLDYEPSATGWSDNHIVALQAAISTAMECGLPFQDGLAAGRAEWAAGQARARCFVDDLRRALFRLVLDRTNGNAIIAAANEVNERYGHALPSVALVDACKAIAASIQPARARRR
jgi:hypothetical protein